LCRTLRPRRSASDYDYADQATLRYDIAQHGVYACVHCG